MQTRKSKRARGTAPEPQADTDAAAAAPAAAPAKKRARRAAAPAAVAAAPAPAAAAAGAPPAAAPAPAPAAPAPPSLTPKQKRVQRLTAALHARGLLLRDDSALCDLYISCGEGEVPEIVDVMERMAFYHEHTLYRDYREVVISREKKYRGKWHNEEVSDDAQRLALEEWASRFHSRAQAADAPELPSTLRGEVRALCWPIEPESTLPTSDEEDDRYDRYGGYGRYGRW